MKEKLPKSLENELEEKGYRIVDQKPGVESVEVDGQVVPLPFTNIPKMKVLLRKEGNVWQYVFRNYGDVFEDEVRRFLNEENNDGN